MPLIQWVRRVFGKYFPKLHAPPIIIVNIIRSFYDGMVGCGIDQGSISAPLDAGSGTKQGSVITPAFQHNVFSHDAFNKCDKGVRIHFRSDGRIFNSRRLQAKTKTSSMLPRMIMFLSPTPLMMLSSLLTTVQWLAADMALPPSSRRQKYCTSWGLDHHHALSASLCAEKHWNRPRNYAITEVFLHRMLSLMMKSQYASVRVVLFNH